MGRKASVDLLGQLKTVVNDFYNGEKVLETPIKRRIQRDLSEERCKILSSLVSLLMETNYSNEETKIYLSNFYITYKGVAEELELKYGDKRLYNTIQSKIAYTKEKIGRDIGINIITDVVDYSTRDISGYLGKIELARKRLDSIEKYYITLGFDGSVECKSNISSKDIVNYLAILNLDNIIDYTKCKNDIKKIGLLDFLRRELTTKELNEQEKKKFEALILFIDGGNSK